MTFLRRWRVRSLWLAVGLADALDRHSSTHMIRSCVLLSSGLINGPYRKLSNRLRRAREHRPPFFSLINELDRVNMLVIGWPAKHIQFVVK